MMNMYRLPTSLEISGVEWQIRTDFRVILDILSYLSDPDLEAMEKVLIALNIFYIDFEKMPKDNVEEAVRKMNDFIDMGMKDEKKPHRRVMDWEQDAPIIIPAVNRALGYEVRAVENLHWWTFLGGYMEIGKCLFSDVTSIRQKKSKRKKLEKHEQEFYRENKALIDLEKRLSAEEQAEMDELTELLG